MSTLFFISFGVGVGFVLLIVVLGEMIGTFNVDSVAGSPANPIVFAIFLTVFGGLGLIIYPYLYWWIDLALAAAGGLFISFLLFRYVWIPIHKWQNTNTHDKQNLIGHSAKVAEYIPQGGYGKITYIINEKIVSGPAKSETGQEIKRGVNVEIVYIEKNTYFVRQKI